MCFGSVGNLQLVEALCGRALSVRRPKCIRIAVFYESNWWCIRSANAHRNEKERFTGGTGRANVVYGLYWRMLEEKNIKNYREWRNLAINNEKSRWRVDENAVEFTKMRDVVEWHGLKRLKMTRNYREKCSKLLEWFFCVNFCSK